MSLNAFKDSIREQVWSRLQQVALPDSRHHYDFAEFIADFRGSSTAIEGLQKLSKYQNAKVVFIAPDNCLEELRFAALKGGKRILMTTYAIRRGFWLLDPAQIPTSLYRYAATLDGMEKVARPIKLVEMVEKDLIVDFLVTGTGAVNMQGVRFGKGHGYFDCEWGMLYDMERVKSVTPVATVAHDCQVIDQDFERAEFDTASDFIATPSRLISVAHPHKPSGGILWDQLALGMLHSIPPLQELLEIRQSGKSFSTER